MKTDPGTYAIAIEKPTSEMGAPLVDVNLYGTLIVLDEGLSKRQVYFDDYKGLFTRGYDAGAQKWRNWYKLSYQRVE